MISKADWLSAVELLRIVDMSSDDKHLYFTVVLMIKSKRR